MAAASTVLVTGGTGYLGSLVVQRLAEQGAEVVALERQLGSMSATNEELRARNERLEVEVAEFRNGLDSVEEMAREELGMVRQGETFYVVVKH
mgnify:CR=1 FL=1